VQCTSCKHATKACGNKTVEKKKEETVEFVPTKFSTHAYLYYQVIEVRVVPCNGRRTEVKVVQHIFFKTVN